ncbi:MAG: UTP--glucose-1-phosphate uridylyltransferase, partial [Oscillospiraceae bacterium]|nr:UTP--glucose-1-phosphate uridylyltransferase [Oscillospiraceae bacterium]
EKPQKHEVFSNFSILGRCVLPAKIFGILEQTQPGLGGEIWLTDAMKRLAREDGMVGVDFEGVRYDTGNKLGFLKAATEIALANEEVGAEFKAYLKELVVGMD